MNKEKFIERLTGHIGDFCLYKDPGRSIDAAHSLACGVFDLFEDAGWCQAKPSETGETSSREVALQSTGSGDAFTASLIESLIRRDAWCSDDFLERISHAPEERVNVNSTITPNAALAILSARSYLLDRHVSKIEEPSGDTETAENAVSNLTPKEKDSSNG